MKITKVYTRKGDDGTTDLVGGVRTRKTDVRLEAYGTIDELSSHLGLLVAMMPDSDDKHRQVVRRIQNCLFNIGTYLATDLSQTPLYPSARLPEGETAFLERCIDQINGILPEQQGFLLPGGTMAAAQCHVCRTVCRRAERRIDTLAEKTVIDPTIVGYVNRLSDYLFVLAKIINFNARQEEIIWQNSCR